MLKRIRTEDVDHGMFLHKLEGPWLAHPFWKRRFLLEDGDQIAALKASKVEWVTIDVSRGRDVAGAPVAAAAPAPPMVAEPIEVAAVPSSAPAPFPDAAPAGRSAQILGRARRSEDVPARMPPPRAPNDVTLTTVPRSLGAEVKSAGDIAQRSRLVIRGLFSQVRLGKAVDIVVVEPLVDDIMRSIQRHPHAFSGVMRLMKTSDYLYTHALSVSALMISLATQLGLKTGQVREAGLAGLLMDIGMGHVPQEIYEKDGALTPAEVEIVHSHTHLAHQFMATGGDVPDSVLAVCLHHHERMDGSGYPNGLAGREIPLFARMAAICDMYDAMTSRRPHKASEDPAAVVAMMRESIDLLDPEIFEAFVKAVSIYPVGSLIRLSNETLALVLDQNVKNPTLPRVRAFFSTADRKLIEPEDVDLVYKVGKITIVGPEKAQDWDLPQWDKMSTLILKPAFAA